MKNICTKTLILLLAMITTVSLYGQPHGQGRRMAVVEFSANYMRTSPDYESGLETQELMGTIVEILQQDRYWRQISTPQPYTAWTTDLGLIEMDGKELEAYKKAPKYIFKELEGQLLTAPDKDSVPVCDLVAGDLLRKAFKKGKAQIHGKWVKALLPSGKEGWVKKSSVEDYSHWLEQTRPSVAGMIGTAEKMTGTPYLWGGMTPKGVDCSGLIRVCAILNNIDLPRNASQMVRCGTAVPMDTDERFWESEARENETAYIREMEERVSHLQPGDLVFFGYPATGEKKERITHVGLYIGGNQIIHSSHVVRKNSLIPGEKDFYENSHKLIKARRLDLEQL